MKRRHLLAIGAFSILLAACVAESQDIPEDVTGESSSASSVAPPPAERTLSGGILEIGSASAETVMRLYVNYDSLYSRQFHGTHMAALADAAAKGTLRLQVVPVAFAKYPDSNRDAAMLLCAAAQGKGAAMHGLLMSGTKTLTPSGTDRARYDACLRDGATDAAVSALAGLAAREGVTVVPAYDIAGSRFTGVPTAADLRGALREHSEKR